MAFRAAPLTTGAFTPQVVALVVKKADELSGHSLRSGLATTATRNGAPASAPSWSRPGTAASRWCGKARVLLFEIRLARFFFGIYFSSREFTQCFGPIEIHRTRRLV
jgi:hypothetical protein